MAKQQHMWDQVADQLTEWMDRESDIIADMIIGGDHAPFSAPNVSEKDKLTYYHQQFFNDDGTPNEVGRSQTLERVGIPGYTAIWGALQKGLEA